MGQTPGVMIKQLHAEIKSNLFPVLPAGSCRRRRHSHLFAGPATSGDSTPLGARSR